MDVVNVLGVLAHTVSSLLEVWVVVFGLCVAASCQLSTPVHLSAPPTQSVVSSSSADAEDTFTAPPLRVDVDVVLVPVRVADSMNRPVTGLASENFSVFEDKRQQQIRYFWREDAPISIGFILDLSGTMADKIELEQAALKEFFKNANPEDDYFVITFAGSPTILADSTKSTADIEAKLALAKPDGFTSLLDAVYLGLQKLQSARYERKALVIVSDGIDNASRYTLGNVKHAVEESDVTVYAVGLFDDYFPISRMIEVTYGKRLLSQMTNAGGGRTIPVTNAENLPKTAAAISVELRNEYVLGYRPSKPTRDPKRRRKIRVEVKSATKKSGKLFPFYRNSYSGRVD